MRVIARTSRAGLPAPRRRCSIDTLNQVMPTRALERGRVS